MAEEPMLNRSTALSLLRPPGHIFRVEDRHHSWSTNSFSPFEMPFLRVWDRMSGSQPTPDSSIESRAPRQHLDTPEARKDSLTIHANHKTWKDTPYISFTTSLEAIQDLATNRAERTTRGSQTLTVVNPNVRIANGLPILDAHAEMVHYEIEDPYGRSYQYYGELRIGEIPESSGVTRHTASAFSTMYGSLSPAMEAPQTIGLFISKP